MSELNSLPWSAHGTVARSEDGAGKLERQIHKKVYRKWQRSLSKSRIVQGLTDLDQEEFDSQTARAKERDDRLLMEDWQAYLTARNTARI